MTRCSLLKEVLSSGDGVVLPWYCMNMLQWGCGIGKGVDLWLDYGSCVMEGMWPTEVC